MLKAINKKVVARRERLVQKTPKMPEAFIYSNLYILWFYKDNILHINTYRESIARNRYQKQSRMF